MNASAAFSDRKDLLLRIVEQFREIADGIGAPFTAEAYITTDEAVLRIEHQGQEESTLRVSARFTDDDLMRHKLVLRWEDCQGEVTKLLGLGWNRDLPGSVEALDGPADHIDADSVYAIGKVTQALRADIGRALTQQSSASVQPANLVRLPTFALAPRDEIMAAPARPALREAPSPRAGAPPPNVKLLQTALGELATAGGLKAENVFASFIETANSGAALKQGDISTYAQAALLELALFNAAFLRRDSTRISDLGLKGGHLRNFVAKTKAALFEEDESVVWQVTREMVTGMRLFYAEALAHAGVPGADAKERLRAAFGKEAAIANDALAILREPEPRQTKTTGPLRRLFGRGLD